MIQGKPPLEGLCWGCVHKPHCWAAGPPLHAGVAARSDGAQGRRSEHTRSGRAEAPWQACTVVLSLGALRSLSP